ncbi:MBL fold metallo-hydrolase, partial [Chlamydiales bacterium]|nr:MBL fold metallo-hydrolase [Chlamydiales bacterium]
MLIKKFTSGPVATNAYVVSCEETQFAWIIDPAPGSAPLIYKYLEEKSLKPKAIILTHSHWDHMGDAAEIKRKLSLPVSIHKDDEANLKKPGADKLPLFFEIEGVTPDNYLQDGDDLSLGIHRFKVIHTPGHSPGSLCLFEEKERVLFSGDTLFQGSIGNISFPTSNASKMWESLKKLELLPPETVVYSGHGENT